MVSQHDSPVTKTRTRSTSKMDCTPVSFDQQKRTTVLLILTLVRVTLLIVLVNGIVTCLDKLSGMTLLWKVTGPFVKTRVTPTTK
jgi:hypothetical protein